MDAKWAVFYQILQVLCFHESSLEMREGAFEFYFLFYNPSGQKATAGANLVGLGEGPARKLASRVGNVDLPWRCR